MCVFCVQLLCVCGQFCDWRSGACSVAGACAPRRLAAVCLLSEVLSVSLQFLVRHHARFSQRLCLLVGNRWPSRLVASFLAGSSGGGGSAGSLSYCDVDVYTSQNQGEDVRGEQNQGEDFRSRVSAASASFASLVWVIWGCVLLLIGMGCLWPLMSGFWSVWLRFIQLKEMEERWVAPEGPHSGDASGHFQ